MSKHLLRLHRRTRKRPPYTRVGASEFVQKQRPTEQTGGELPLPRFIHIKPRNGRPTKAPAPTWSNTGHERFKFVNGWLFLLWCCGLLDLSLCARRFYSLPSLYTTSRIHTLSFVSCSLTLTPSNLYSRFTPMRLPSISSTTPASSERFAQRLRVREMLRGVRQHQLNQLSTPLDHTTDVASALQTGTTAASASAFGDPPPMSTSSSLSTLGISPSSDTVSSAGSQIGGGGPPRVGTPPPQTLPSSLSVWRHLRWCLSSLVNASTHC